MNTTKEFLLDVPVLARTDSYSPVSHNTEFHNFIEREFQLN